MKPTFPTEIFENNMMLLKARFPEMCDKLTACNGDVSFAFEAIETSYGQANISVKLADGNNVNFYEGDDIIGGILKQMADWDLGGADFLFCVGMGLGYLPLLASQHFAGKPRIVVIEPNPEILLLALKSIDLRPLLSYERIDFYLGPDLPVSHIIGNYGELIFFGKNRLVSHGTTRLLLGERFRALENDVVDNIRVVRNIGYTAKHAGKMIFSNTMKNLPSLFSGPDLRSLEGRFKGCPAICVAAGPSLDKDLAGLKSVGNRALILCADSAVRSLVNEGIVPHMVVTTDMNPENFEKLRTSLEHLRESVLVFSIEANPDNVGSFLGPRRIAVTSKNAILNRWLGPRWSLDWQLPAMTSVSHTALFTAIALGAGPIILVGMDFAYSSGKSHANGSVFRYPANINEAIQVEGVKGYPVHSLPQLITDRKQIENAMANSAVQFIDTSLDGALISGAENRSLKEILDTTLQSDIDVSSVLESIDWVPSVPGEAVAMEFEMMTQRVERFISACQTRAEQCRISGSNPAEESNGQRSAQLAQEIRNGLPRFERKNGELLSLLKLIRYGDVKEISKRLDTIRRSGAKDNRKLSALKELEVYADYFASLKGAGRHFKTALMSVSRFFNEESELMHNIDYGTSVVDQIFSLADHYRTHGLFYKAEPALVRYIEKKRSEDKDAWLSLGRMFADKRLWSLARAYVKQMKLHFPGDNQINALDCDIDKAITALRNSAADLIEAGDVEEARRKLYEYLSLVKDDASAESIREKIDVYDRERAYAMSQPESIRMSAAQKKDLHQRVQDCLAMGATEKAVGVLEGLAQMEGENAWRPREKIGDIRLSQKDVVSARWHYRQAFELSPKNAELTSKLGTTLQQTENGTNQMENTTANRINCRTNAQSQLETPEEMYGQAQAQIEQDAYPEAVQILERLLADYPDFGLAHNDLGVLNYKQGNMEKSFFHYQEAARIDPHNPVFQKNLADFHYVVRGEVQPALEIYVDLLSLNPMDKEALMALGHICIEQGKADDAAVFYQRILDIDPENNEANQALAELSDRSGLVGQDSTQARAHGASAMPDVFDVRTAPTFPSPVVKTQINTNNRSYVVQIPEQEMFRITSIFEQKEYAVMGKRRREGVFNVFDVGANVGLFALWVHAIHPNSKIYCFEPSPAARTLLEVNVGDLPEMVICKYGLYNRDMQTPMNVHQYNTGQNSIRFAGRHHTGTVDVQVMDAGGQFDVLGMSHLDILKIDTEGCEVEILESMGERLDNVDYILLEYHSEKDRRAIDALLTRFHLFEAHSVVAEVGTVKYVHPSLV